MLLVMNTENGDLNYHVNGKIVTFKAKDYKVVPEDVTLKQLQDHFGSHVIYEVTDENILKEYETKESVKENVDVEEGYKILLAKNSAIYDEVLELAGMPKGSELWDEAIEYLATQVEDACKFQQENIKLKEEIEDLKLELAKSAELVTEATQEEIDDINEYVKDLGLEVNTEEVSIKETTQEEVNDINEEINEEIKDLDLEVNTEEVSIKETKTRGRKKKAE